MPVVHVTSGAEFARLVVNSNNNGGIDKLFVVDFGASWCGPCKKIAPVFEQLSNKYSHSNFQFLHVDVDECAEVAQEQGIKALPTFVFYKNNPETELTRIQGADPEGLESKVVEYWKQFKPYFSGEGNKLGGSSECHSGPSVIKVGSSTSSSTTSAAAVNLSLSEIIMIAQTRVEYDEGPGSCRIGLRFQPAIPPGCLLSGSAVKPSVRINPSEKIAKLRDFIDTLFELTGIESKDYKLFNSYPPRALDEDVSVDEGGVAGAAVVVKFC